MNQLHTGRLSLLLDELSGELGDQPFIMDNEGQCHLIIDKTYSVTLSQHDDPDRIRLTAILPESTPALKGSDFRKLCQANLFLQESDGLTLGLTPDRKQVMLRYDISIEAMDISMFKALIESFVNGVEKWHHILSDTSSDSVTDGELDHTLSLFSSGIRV